MQLFVKRVLELAYVSVYLVPRLTCRVFISVLLWHLQMTTEAHRSHAVCPHSQKPQNKKSEPLPPTCCLFVY